ncbi:coenzyme A transporter [Xanthoria parietina]
MPPPLPSNEASLQPSGANVMQGQGNETRKSPILPYSTDTTVAVQANGSQRRNKQNLDYVLRTGLAGGLAGCAAKTIVGPLDRVKILFQASNPQFAKYTGSWFGVVTAMRDINRQSGLRGLFRGHSATLLRIFPYASIKFLAYEQFRAVCIPTPAHETPLRRLVSGAAAGVTSVFITYPLEVIRVRLAFETKHEARSSLAGICRQIYREQQQPQAARISPSSAASASGTTVPVLPTTTTTTMPRTGLVNFYRGFSPTLAGMLPYAGMSFLTHDTAGDWLRRPALAPYTTIANPNHASSAPPILRYWAELIAGGFAGLVSQTASYPLEVIRRRMQVGGAVGDGHRLGMAETAATVWRERGWRGFFVGLGIGYFKVVPMAAVSFYVYERGKVGLGV